MMTVSIERTFRWLTSAVPKKALGLSFRTTTSSGRGAISLTISAPIPPGAALAVAGRPIDRLLVLGDQGLPGSLHDPTSLSVLTSMAPACSGPEQLHEALLDLVRPPLDLLGIHHEHLEVGELGAVGRVRHLRMSHVESLAVGEKLLDLAREDEVREH